MDDKAASPTGPESAHSSRLSQAARQQLPAGYGAALEGLATGATDPELAKRAGVDPAAVPALVRLAAAKLLEPEASREIPSR